MPDSSVIAEIVETMRNLTAGIEPSDDPILAGRSAAYSISYDKRSRGE